MLIRRNTKQFKTILEIVTACQSRDDRRDLVRIYITKAGHTIKDRINVEGIEGEAGVFYDMNYMVLLNNLNSPNHQVHHSDDTPGIYYFHNNLNKAWEEAPFEFDEAIKTEFASLPELPVTRKKEKAEKYTFPVPGTRTASQKVQAQKEKADTKKTSKKSEEKPKPEGPKQPGYKLKHKILFSDLDKVTFKESQLTKKDVLDYYYKMAEYTLPYLKDRAQLIRVHSERGKSAEYLNLESLPPQIREELPEWIQTAEIAQGKEHRNLLLCEDLEHLLFYAGMGCLEFNPCHSQIDTLDMPDYVVIGIDPPEAAFSRAVDVALAAKEILDGLWLPSFVKTDGLFGLHLYIPLDSKCDFETGKNVAEYLCKLMRLKIPDLVTLADADAYGYGKVVLDYLTNEEGKTVIAPYSIRPGDAAIVATPLLWEEVNEDLRVTDFDTKSIFKRLKDVGDPFEVLFKKKVNADALLERLEENYAFLLR
jgi:bifunctional non-homologous end joining protein LigD